MGINIPLLNSCCCCSLRTGAIIVGSLQLLMYTLYFIDTLIFRLWQFKIENVNETYYMWITDIIFEHAEIIQLVFSVILIYGAVKEKSSLVTAWLLVELAKGLDGIWNMALFSVFFFHWRYFIEELLLIGKELIDLWVVYSYFSTMPKSKYICNE